MLNTLSTTVFDPVGYVEIEVENDVIVGTPTRRVSRVATLDGSAVYNDAGYSEADRIITLIWRVRGKAVEDAVDRMIQLYSIVLVSTRRGVFRALLETYTPGQDESSLRLLVLSKLSS